MSTLPFDRITVVIGGTESKYSVGEFLKLPLSDRVKSLLFGKISFFSDDAPVNSREALNALRTHGMK